MNRCLFYFVLLLPLVAEASTTRREYWPLALVAGIVACVLSWWWVKRTAMLDNVHLKIIGFSVYFWIVVFAEVIVYGIYRYISDAR